jgi:2-hydroxy-6-oxonona-2,4-dienedioate hydrolase
MHRAPPLRFKAGDRQNSHRMSPKPLFIAGRNVGARRQRWRWTAFAVLAVAMMFGGPAQANSEDGAIAGLTPKFIDVNGVTTRYYEAGEGEPLILVHGEGWSGHSSANTWSKTIPGLAKRFHVFAPDKLGSGMTGNPPDDKDYNIQGEIEHMLAFIKVMKLDKVHLVGQSRGGGLVFFLAVAHPEMVKTLVIVDTLTAAPKGPNDHEETLGKCRHQPSWEAWKCRLQALSYRPEVAFDDELFDAGRYMASLPKSHETRAKRKAGAGEPLRSQFKAWKKTVHARIESEAVLQMPVLIYWGRNDPSALLARGLALFDVIARKNPRVRMFTVNDAGHFHYREYPDEFNDNVINFIDYWERPQ